VVGEREGEDKWVVGGNKSKPSSGVKRRGWKKQGRSGSDKMYSILYIHEVSERGRARPV